MRWRGFFISRRTIQRLVASKALVPVYVSARPLNILPISSAPETALPNGKGRTLDLGFGCATLFVSFR